MPWDIIILPAVMAVAGMLCYWLISEIREATKKWRTNKKECPRCSSLNVKYLGRTKMKWVRKKNTKSLITYYLFECTACKIRFEYYGTL
jgi:hypothetical protein